MSHRPPRREFLVAALGAMARSAAAQDGSSVPPRAIGAGEGELFYVGRTRDPVRIKVSPPRQGRFAMIVQEVAPGSVIPVHLHEREDEIIFIQSGEGSATIGKQQVNLRAGSTLYVPQGTWHGGENTGSSVMQWVALYSPSGFEGYFRAIGTKTPGDKPARRTAAEQEALDRKYGIRYPG
jgi:mannose-6-phosphate isomerase-like protein (cupin superfamily)